MSELISKEKVIRLINDAIDNAKTEFFESEWVRGEVNGLGVAKDIILSGQCDPDPVPTIKPGDRVNHNGFQFPFLKGVKVDHLQFHRYGTYAVLEHDGEAYTVPLDSLEVVKDG